MLGDAADVRGFRLAGMDGVVCRRRDDVEAALDRLHAAPTFAPALVLVSASVYQLVRGRVDEERANTAGPLLLVLPTGSPGEET